MLKFLVDSLDGIDKALHAFYEKVGEKYQLKVEGVKTQADVDTVSNARKAEYEAHKVTKAALQELKNKFAPLGDRDPNDIAAQLDRIPTLEEAAAGKGVSEEKIAARVQAGVDRGVAAKLAPLQRENDALKLTNGELGKTNETLSTAQKNRTIDDAVRSAAAVAKVSEHALPDVIELLRGKFLVGDDGKVLTEAGLDPTAIINDSKKLKPHWWPVAQGAGAQGGSGGTHVADADNPWSGPGWNLTKQSQMVTGNRTQAEALAKAAGHAGVAGAVRPAVAVK